MRRHSMRSSQFRKLCIGLAVVAVLAVAGVTFLNASCPVQGCTAVGQEVAIPVHLTDGQEFTMSTKDLIAFGNALFNAMWTQDEGQGRPMTKGTGNPISDPTSPLTFPKNFNPIPTRGGVDELGKPVTLQTIANSRKTVGMFGSGYLENVAIEITADLQAQAAACAKGSSCALSSKGVSFGT